VLDVGSGPLSALGTQWGDRDVELVPVDILAREYADDLEAAGLNAPVPPVYAHAEELEVSFGRDRFDAAYACNAYVAMKDPLLALQQTLAVLKPRAWLITWHAQELGSRNHYQRLFGWDFVRRGDRLKLVNGGKVYDVLDFCPEAAEIESEVKGEYVYFALRKVRPGEASASVRAPLNTRIRPPLVSLHIPKTAGSSLRNILQDWFGDKLYLDYNGQTYWLDPTRIPPAAPEADCLHGHFRSDAFDAFLPHVPKITWLRIQWNGSSHPTSRFSASLNATPQRNSTP